jgi:hypothetical protein
MSTNLGEKAMDNMFRVISVEPADTPDGMPEANWHRYVIERGKQRIEGIKPGSLREVTEHANNEVESLNDRATRGGSTYAARGRKKK